MRCSRCQHENAAGAKFCGECGGRIDAACTACGTVNPPTNKFCQECGASVRLGAPSEGSPLPLPNAVNALTPVEARFTSPDAYTPSHLARKILSSRTSLAGERKKVTVLFADLKGSLELLADRDPEDARALLDGVLERMMEAVHRYEGTVNQVMGDGIMALFGAPVAHEDHAVRACYAALRMQRSVSRYADELRRGQGIDVQIRAGINSGDVVVRSIGSDLNVDYSAVGQTTHLAARMEQLARPGTVMITDATRRLADRYIEVAGQGLVPVKGLKQPVEVFELTGAPPASRVQSAGGALTRFLGREDELRGLERLLEKAGQGEGQVIGLAGEAGVGKSRLVWEFTRSTRTQASRARFTSRSRYRNSSSACSSRTLLETSTSDGNTSSIRWTSTWWIGVRVATPVSRFRKGVQSCRFRASAPRRAWTSVILPNRCRSSARTRCSCVAGSQ